MAFIKVKIIDQSTLELLEDAKKGDIIDLSSVTTIDTALIQKSIEEAKEIELNKIVEEKEEIYRTKLEKSFLLQKEQLNEESNNKIEQLNSKINELTYQLKSVKDNFDKEIEMKESKIKNDYDIQLEKDNSKFESQINSLKAESEKNKLKYESDKKYLTSDYENKIKELNNKIDNLNTTHRNEINLINTKNEAEKNNLSSKIEIANSEKELALKSQKMELTQNFSDQIKEIEDERDEYIKKYNQLSLNKSSLNVKKLGEELERWCCEEYQNAAIAGFNNCTWEKDNNSKQEFEDDKKTKADFIFKVFSGKPDECSFPLASVCLEMKNESNVSNNKKKNSDHFKKLDGDRRKNNCEYALLVSELEWNSNNDSPIKKVSEYEKMYIVRPQYMITFLSIIYTLASKYSDILNAKEKEELNLKSAQEIMNDFENLKVKYLDKPISELEKKVSDLSKNNDTILVAARKNQDLLNSLVETTISNIKAKIERFNIKKIAKKLD